MATKVELPFESMSLELPAEREDAMAAHLITDPTEKPEVHPDLESSKMDVETALTGAVDQLRAVHEDDFKSDVARAVDQLLPESFEAMQESLGVAIDQLPAELSVALEEGPPSVAAVEARIEIAEETDSQLAEDIKLAEEILAAEVGKGIDMSDTTLTLPGQRLDLENPVIEIIKELEQQTLTDAFSPPEATEEIALVAGTCPTEKNAVEALPGAMQESLDEQTETSCNEIGEEAATKKETPGNPSPPAVTPKSLEPPAATPKSLESSATMCTSLEPDVDMLPLATRLTNRWDKTISSPRREATPVKRAPKCERNSILNEPSLRSSPRLGRSPAGCKSSLERQSTDETIDNSRCGREQARSSGTEMDHGEKSAIQRTSRSTQRKEKKKKRADKDKVGDESQDETPTQELAAPDGARDQPSNSGVSTGDNEERAQSSRTPKAMTDTVKRFDRRDSPRTDLSKKCVQSKENPHSSLGRQIASVDPKKEAMTEQSLTEAVDSCQESKATRSSAQTDCTGKTDLVEKKLEAPKEDIYKQTERDKEVKIDPEKMNATPEHETVKPKHAEPKESKKRGRPRLKRNVHKYAQAHLDSVKADKDKNNSEKSSSKEKVKESDNTPSSYVEPELVRMIAEPKAPGPEPVQLTDEPSTENPEPEPATASKSSRNEKVKDGKRNTMILEQPSTDGIESEKLEKPVQLTDEPSTENPKPEPATASKSSRNEKVKDGKRNKTILEQPSTDGIESEKTIETTERVPVVASTTTPGPVEEKLSRKDKIKSRKAIHTNAVVSGTKTEPEPVLPEPLNAAKGGPSKEEKLESNQMNVDLPSAARAEPETAANKPATAITETEPVLETPPEPSTSSKSMSMKEKPTSRKPKPEPNNKKEETNRESSQPEASEATVEPKPQSSQDQILKKHKSRSKQHTEMIKTEPKVELETTEPGQTEPKAEKLKRRTRSEEPKAAPERSESPSGKSRLRKPKSNKPLAANEPESATPNTPTLPAKLKEKSDLSQAATEAKSNEETEQISDETMVEKKCSSKRGATSKQRRNTKTIPDGASEQHALEAATTPKQIVPITPRTAPCRQLRVLMRRTPSSSTSSVCKIAPALSLRDKISIATEAPSSVKREKDKAKLGPQAKDKPDAVPALKPSSVEQPIVDTKEEQLMDKHEEAHQEKERVEEEPAAEATEVMEESTDAVHKEVDAPSIAASVEEATKEESPLREETAEDQPLETPSGEPDKEEENSQSTVKIDDSNMESVNPTVDAPKATTEESNDDSQVRANSPATKEVTETTDSQATKEVTEMQATTETTDIQATKEITESQATKEIIDSAAKIETTDSQATKEITDSPVKTETTDSSQVTQETTGVTVAPESSKSIIPGRALRNREVETPQPDEAARRKQQQQLERSGKDKHGQKKPVRRRNQLEAEERPPQKRTKIEDEGTAAASTSASANVSAKGKFVSLIGKDTILSTTTDPQVEPSKSSGGARKSNVKLPKVPDTTKHIIISTVPKKSLDATAESSPASSKKPLVQSLINSYVDARKTTQKDSAPAGKKLLSRSETAAANKHQQDPEQNIPSSTVLTKKDVTPAGNLLSKKAAETPKGDGVAVPLRKVNISVSVMPSKESDYAADAAGKSGATSSAATAAQVTKALLDAEKNIISARRPPVDTKKKPEAKKTVKISEPDKTKTMEQSRKELRRSEIAEKSNKPETSTAPSRKSLPHAEPPRKPEPRKSEEAARIQAKSVNAKMPAVAPIFKANEAGQKAKYEQRSSDVAAFRGKATTRTAEVETGPAPRDSSHDRAGRTSRLGKGISLPTLRTTAISSMSSSHMTRAASSNRSLASTPVHMAATPTPMAAGRRPAPRKLEPVATTSSVEPLAPPKKMKRSARLPFGSRRKRSGKKRKATEDSGEESEATTQKRPRGDQDQEQEPEARPAPSIAFPVMITAASSSALSPIPHSVAGPAAVKATSTSQPIRKSNLRKCLVKINRRVVQRWLAANIQKQPAAALKKQRSTAPPVRPAPEPEPQTEGPAPQPVQHQVPVPEPAPDPDPAPVPVPARQPPQPTPSAPVVAAAVQSVSVSGSGSGGPQVQKKTHGVLAMKLPIPIPVMEIKTEIEEEPPETPMEATLATLSEIPIPIPTPTVVAPQVPAETMPPEEMVPLPPSTSSQQTIRISAPPAPVARSVSSIPSASSAESSQKPGHTKIFSFLHPQRYQRSYGEVGLDFCCPNLDGPMRAIDPTRVHATAQVPVLELPQFMVITTKIISKADKDLPHKVRAKLAQLDKTGRPLGTQPAQPVRMSLDSGEPSISAAVPSSNLAPCPVPPLTAISNAPPPTATTALPVSQDEVTVQSLTKQLPRGTTLTKKVLPPGAAPPAAASSSMVASLPPALIQLPPICPTDKQRVELQTRVQMFDLVLQGLSRRAATLTVAERQRTIEEIVKTSTLMAIDVDVGTKLLENYVYYLNRATNIQTPMPSLRLNPVVTPAATQSALTVASLLGNAPVPKRKVSAPSAIATGTVSATTTPSAPATKKPAQQRSSVPTGIPVYDAERNIIGYQCHTPNTSIVNRPGPMASSTPLGPSTSAAAQSGLLGASSKSARTGVQQNQSKKTKPSPAMAVKAVPKGSSSGKRLGSGAIVSIHPPSEQKASPASKPPVGVAQTLASLSPSPVHKAVPVPVPGSKSKSATPAQSGRPTGMNRARSPNVFIINQVSPQAEESILPDSNSVPMEAEIKGELDDSAEMIG